MMGTKIAATRRGLLNRLVAAVIRVWLVTTLPNSFALATTTNDGSGTRNRAILVTGGNKGQGFALCQRILAEHDDTFLYLCSRDKQRGQRAVDQLARELKIENQDQYMELVELDVTDKDSIQRAVAQVREGLAQRQPSDPSLYGVVCNAGILWGYPLIDQMAVNARGPCLVMNAFLPLLHPQQGRLVVVSTGLAPLMHSYASPERQKALQSPTLTLEELEEMIQECLQAHDDGFSCTNGAKATGSEALAAIGFPGGPFAETVPDFHRYGISKMFADAYMLRMARQHAPDLSIFSCDPGLVYTDLILSMPKYDGMTLEESGAQTPAQGVEAAMKLLFVPEYGTADASGYFYAMNKAKTRLLKSKIDTKPTET